VAWAVGNRAALVRIPGPGAARHLEYRLGDAAANPYLALTGLLAAAADGLDRSAEAPAPVDGDVGHWSDEACRAAGIDRLPVSLDAALDALAADDVLLSALGPVIAEHYPLLKRFEAATDRDAVGAAAARSDGVTEEERSTYLEPL
jgi:glutamine synthetase